VRTIPHRELRNDSARILAAVKAGEVIQVTNGGEVAAILVPPTTSRLDVLRLAGKITTPEPLDRLDGISPVTATESTQDVLDALRAER